MSAVETPQTPTDGNPAVAAALNTAAPAKAETAAPAAPVADAKQAEQPKQPDQAAEQKPLPGLSTEAPKKEAPTQRPGAPEKYEWKIEGEKTYVDSLTKTLEPTVRELGLSNDEAHKVYDTFAKIAGSAKERMVKTWADGLHTDKEIGGARLEESLGVANAVLAKYGDDEFRGLLDQGGLRHNPALVRLLVRMGRDVSGDRIVTSAPPKDGPQSDADLFYPPTK